MLLVVSTVEGNLILTVNADTGVDEKRENEVRL